VTNVKRFLVTTAINQTLIFQPFWRALNVAAKHLDAEIVIQAGVYRNPSAMNKRKRSDDTYAVDLHPYLTRKRRALGKNLTLFADVPVQPTATSPTSGFEVLASGGSAIIGHVTHQMRVVPGAKSPRVLWTTGAVTLPKYSKSRAGARAREHHILGALIVEVCRDGTYFVRELRAHKKTGAFVDLGTLYTQEGVSAAPRALSLTLGDVHVGSTDPTALKASHALAEEVKPVNLVLHDVLDFDSRSHHRRDKRSGFDRRTASVKAEVQACVSAMNEMAAWADTTHIVASNHHDHLGRWLEECDPKLDPVNARYYHELWSMLLSEREAGQPWRDAFEAACRIEKADERIQFAKRGLPLNIGGVRHDLHGDVGVSGSRGSLLGFTRMGCKVTIGHSHTPGRRDGVVQVGCLQRHDIEYATRGPSTWLFAHCVLNYDGSRQIVITQGSKYRA
jgi:hypothetical protein